jgi:hypothetical protein
MDTLVVVVLVVRWCDWLCICEWCCGGWEAVEFFTEACVVVCWAVGVRDGGWGCRISLLCRIRTSVQPPVYCAVQFWALLSRVQLL